MDWRAFIATNKKRLGTTSDEEIVSAGIVFISAYLEEFKKRLDSNASNHKLLHECTGPSITLGNKRIQFEDGEKEIRVLQKDCSKSCDTTEQLLDTLFVSSNKKLVSMKYSTWLDEELIKQYINRII